MWWCSSRSQSVDMELPASLDHCSHTIPGKLRKHPLRDYAQRHYPAARSAFACEPCVARSSSAKASEGATRADLRSLLHKRPAEDGHVYRSDQVPLRYSVDASSLAVAEGLLIGAFRPVSKNFVHSTAAAYESTYIDPISC